jgi:hypothetical protein
MRCQVPSGREIHTTFSGITYTEYLEDLGADGMKTLKCI